MSQGEAELELMRLQKKRPDVFVVHIARPGVVTATNSLFPAVLEPLTRFINIDDLAAKMVNTAINGHTAQLLEQDVLRDEGKRLRKKALTDAR